MSKTDTHTNNHLTAVSDGMPPAYDTVSVPSAPSVRKLIRDTPLIIFVLLCSVFQMSCIQVDGNFNTGVAAISNQVEDSVSSGMLLTSAYTDYFQEFNRWPDSHAKLVEYYKTKAKTDASLIAVYKQLEEFTEVKVVSIEDRIIELEFRRPPISPVNDNRSVATGKVIIDAGCP